ncbi:MAG: hypothetical protein CVU11_08405 [Bacteroidetes bacterium HGW-Bacteroidetes-6]|jgi:TonB family protein|nr:MAG: hypothetical protein CVU11_08405 [Bacteroidetes bacterium HGW-Bacteroidetes-6]
MSAETYLLKSYVVLLILGGIYWLILRSRISISASRSWLLLSFAASLTVPFLNFQAITTTSSTIAALILPELIVDPNTGTASSILDFYILLRVVFTSVSGIFLFQFIFSIIRIAFLYLKHPTNHIGSNIVVSLDENKQAFSFFRLLFIPKDMSQNEIVLHEEQHARLWHSADIVFVRLARLLFWAHPLFWLLERELTHIHEYQADRAVLRRGVNTQNYMQLLLNITMGNTSGLPVNQFSKSIIKKRIIMMKQNKTFRLISLRWLIALPTALLAIWLVGCQSKSTDDKSKNDDSTTSKTVTTSDVSDNNSEVFDKVEKAPEYPGGQEAMGQFFSKTVKYPAVARENGVQGTVYVDFVVDKSGKVTNPSVIQSVSSELDAEALRVVGLMPKWTPGEQDGKTVSVKMTLPVKFKLQ